MFNNITVFVYLALTTSQREKRRWQIIRKPTSIQAQPSLRLLHLPHHKRRTRRLRRPHLLPTKHRHRSDLCDRTMGTYPTRMCVYPFPFPFHSKPCAHQLTPKTVPELRIYRIWDKPIGPHPIAMFEVNLFTPAQFGAFIPWLVINRGPLSALLHPNTGDDIRDHTQRATWLGQPFPLQVGLLRRMLENKAQEAGQKD